MSVEISLLKTGFVKTQADVFLAQSNLAQSSRSQSDFLFSISTKVDAKVSDQSFLLDSLDKCMGIRPLILMNLLLGSGLCYQKVLFLGFDITTKKKIVK